MEQFESFSITTRALQRNPLKSERDTGLEPATPSLGICSTIEG